MTPPPSVLAPGKPVSFPGENVLNVVDGRVACRARANITTTLRTIIESRIALQRVFIDETFRKQVLLLLFGGKKKKKLKIKQEND